MKNPSQPPTAEGSSRKGGFSLVEIVVAMVVLTYGVLGLAGTTLYVVREITIADLATKRTVAVQSVMERARAMPFDSTGSGSDSIGAYELAWSATAETTRTKVIRVIATGPGLVTGSSGPMIAAAAVDTFQFRAYRP